MEKWWNADKEVVAESLGTDAEKGLTSQKVTERQLQYGPNQLAEKEGKSAISLFFDQFKDFMIWVLIGAALVSGFLKVEQNGGILLALVCVPWSNKRKKEPFLSCVHLLRA